LVLKPVSSEIFTIYGFIKLLKFLISAFVAPKFRFAETFFTTIRISIIIKSEIKGGFYHE